MADVLFPFICIREAVVARQTILPCGTRSLPEPQEPSLLASSTANYWLIGHSIESS